MSMENSSETIGNRTTDLPACSAASERTACPIKSWTTSNFPVRHIFDSVSLEFASFLCYRWPIFV